MQRIAAAHETVNDFGHWMRHTFVAYRFCKQRSTSQRMVANTNDGSNNRPRPAHRCRVDDAERFPRLSQRSARRSQDQSSTAVKAAGYAGVQGGDPETRPRRGPALHHTRPHQSGGRIACLSRSRRVDEGADCAQRCMSVGATKPTDDAKALLDDVVNASA